MYHDVFLNTKKRDLYPYTSREGAGRTLPRGGRMVVAKRHPRCRHAAKGIELGTPKNNPAPQDYQITKT